MPEVNPACNEHERNKYALNFYNYAFLLALDDLRKRWQIEITDMTALNEWAETIMGLQEFRDELIYLASLLPSRTYYRFWIVLMMLVFSGKLGDLAPHLADWAKYFRGEYDVGVKADNYGNYLEIRIYSQLAGEDWTELTREAKNQSKGLEPKSTYKGDDPYMLATLANLARDKQKDLSNIQLAWRLSELGYTDKDGNPFSANAIDKKLSTADSRGF